MGNLPHVLGGSSHWVEMLGGMLSKGQSKEGSIYSDGKLAPSTSGVTNIFSS
jgi:hypothetical protein